MLHDRRAQTIAEWIVIVAIGVALTGGVIWTVFNTLRAKYVEVNAEIGS